MNWRASLPTSHVTFSIYVHANHKPNDAGEVRASLPTFHTAKISCTCYCITLDIILYYIEYNTGGAAVGAHQLLVARGLEPQAERRGRGIIYYTFNR